MEEQLNPFTKEVFGIGLKEWRVIVNEYETFFSPQSFRIIAKDEQQALEILFWFTENIGYDDYKAAFDGTETLLNYEDADSCLSIVVSGKYNGTPNNEELYPSITEIDIMDMSFKEPKTTLTQWEVPWEELRTKK